MQSNGTAALLRHRPVRLTATDRVYRSLRRAISEGELGPGQRLRAEQVARRHRVSRTPVREAFRHLAAEGLVVILPHAGAQVASYSLADIDELFEIRGALEVLAAQRAVARADARLVERLRAQLQRCARAVHRGELEAIGRENAALHALVYAAAASPQLVRLIESLGEKLRSFRAASLSSTGRPVEAFAEHRAMVAAIARRDVGAVRRLATEHAERARLAATRWYVEQARASPRRGVGGSP